MSANFLNSQMKTKKPQWPVFALPFWVLASFALAQVVVVGVLYGLQWTGVTLVGLNEAVYSTVIAATVYVLSVVIALGAPWLIKKYRTTRQDIGLTRLPIWLDIGLAPVGFIVYLICSVAIVSIAIALVPSIDLNQVQDTGFANLTHRYEYILALITLVIIAPVFEEILFRGYFYGKLRRFVPVWVAILIVSIVFAAIHGQWNVALDVFALSVVLCGLREMTGSIWAGILLHMAKNGFAFYFLFINTGFLSTMGG